MLAAPVLLLSTHEVEAFSCGVESLDLWLKRRALNNQITGASRMFVVGEKDRVAAYYALAFGGLVVHALSVDAKAFYESLGFNSSPLDPIGERFAFGENWLRFLQVLNEDRIQQAEQSLRSMLGVADL